MVVPELSKPMFQYYFIIHRVGISNRDWQSVWLPDSEAAIAYALQVVRELKEDGGYEDPDLYISIEDWNGRVIFSLPFFGTA